MKHWKGIALGLLLLCGCTPVFAAEAETPKPYNFVYEIGRQMPTINLAGEITTEEMEARLHSTVSDDLLYMVGAGENVIAFRYLAEDRASCKQIVFASPAETVIQFYTNDKDAWNQMYRTLKSYTGEWNLVNGYKVVAEKHVVAKLDNEKEIYRIWFSKVKPDNRVVRVVDDPVPYPYYYSYPVDFWLYWHPLRPHHYPHRPYYGPPRHYGSGPRPSVVHRPPGGPRPGVVHRPGPRSSGGHGPVHRPGPRPSGGHGPVHRPGPRR